MLAPDKYIQAIELTQVVSVDLIIEDEEGHILVGRRTNQPAQGSLFVPGGRVFKMEKWQNAVPRLSKWELGIELKDWEFVGVNDHIYETNFLEAIGEDDNDIPTHYVCIAVKATIKRTELDEGVFQDQHSETLWETPENLLKRDDVHQYTKNYFL